tara:strand:+ start:8924 stop:9604 length:681 start_codon:yes stop_codon:yes gene_type:complete
MPITREQKLLQEAKCKTYTYDMNNSKILHIIDKRETQVTSEDIKNIKNEIKRELKRNCRNAVNNKYGEGSIDSADYIIIGQTDNNTKNKICGFVTIKDNKNELYIDLICTPQTIPRIRGSVLLQHVEDLAVHLKRIRIRLSSLDEPLCFYASRGYEECDDACDIVKYGTCNSVEKKAKMGDSENGWRMTKCTKENILKNTNTKIKNKTYNTPRKCKENKRKVVQNK